MTIAQKGETNIQLSKAYIAESRAKREISLARAKRLKHAARESLAVRSLHKAQLICRLLSSPGKDIAAPQNKIDLAQAYRNIIQASERLSVVQFQEAQEQAKLFQGILLPAHHQTERADLEIAHLRDKYKHEGIPLAPTPFQLPEYPDPLPPSLHLPQFRLTDVLGKDKNRQLWLYDSDDEDMDDDPAIYDDLFDL